MPMFPLGTVLFPSAVLPLHVFEPRYRELARHCMDADREFGVVLIERGSEVGGGDTRSAIGTCAKIIEAEEFEDGRWGLITVGDRRIRIRDWVSEEPFPTAEVEDWPDPDADDPELGNLFRSVAGELRQLLALKTEMGMPSAPATVELVTEPALGSYQIAAVSPLGVMDRQTLLAAPSIQDRLDAVQRLMAEESEMLKAQLALEPDRPDDDTLGGRTGT